jgi:hypothetical protein
LNLKYFITLHCACPAPAPALRLRLRLPLRLPNKKYIFIFKLSRLCAAATAGRHF